MYKILPPIWFQAIFAILDTIVSSRPWKIGHFWMLMLLGVIYCSFNYVYVVVFNGTNFKNEEFIYPVLDWKKDFKSAMIFCSLSVLFLGIIHCMFCLISYLRDRIWCKIYGTENYSQSDFPSFESSISHVWHI